MLKELLDLSYVSNSTPDMFRHMVAIHRVCRVPDKLLKRCTMLWVGADYDTSRVASCRGMTFQPFPGFLLISSVPQIVNVMSLVVPVAACVLILCCLRDSIMAQYTQ
jgi:hypothetical protein